MCVFISKRKTPVVPNPVPTYPMTSTPEPDTSTVPLDNATIPKSALQAPTGTQHPQTLIYCTVCVLYIVHCMRCICRVICKSYGTSGSNFWKEGS